MYASKYQNKRCNQTYNVKDVMKRSFLHDYLHLRIGYNLSSNNVKYLTGRYTKYIILVLLFPYLGSIKLSCYCQNKHFNATKL